MPASKAMTSSSRASQALAPLHIITIAFNITQWSRAATGGSRCRG